MTTDRFWPKVDKSGDCWLWQSTIVDGYGVFLVDSRVDRRPVKAHRFAYEVLVGPIPAGLTLDHLCRNRACVNPAHLEPVTNAVNIRRGESFAGVNSRKTHCIHGHAFAPENTMHCTSRGRPCRRCRTCHNESGRRHDAKSRAIAS